MTKKPAVCPAELRRPAELKIQERQKKRPATQTGKANALRLVHELEVHQIELEMQQEELIAARVELEAALDQYTNLYDFAPVGYFTLTREGQIRGSNLAVVTAIVNVIVQTLNEGRFSARHGCLLPDLQVMTELGGLLVG